jgi:redox-sensitive bicupin YhaK (pirin superfamily)
MVKLSLMKEAHPSESPILESAKLGFPWPTVDPFLFCAYHNDEFPEGTSELGPDPKLLQGRNMGMDFTVKDGFRMYHGDTVPGFPAHPHRGFETVTLVRKGYCDHADSLGAEARFGAGDAQWITTGGGIVHSEMFPLLKSDAPNPLELFQIWLNLPAESKMTPAHFKVLWGQEIPKVQVKDAEGHTTTVTVVAGEYNGKHPPSPPPHSWAIDPKNDVAVWVIKLESGSKWTLPKTAATSGRALYFFEGETATIGGTVFDEHRVAIVRADQTIEIFAPKGDIQLLLLQGRPIGQPVAQHGPFVMNTRQEIRQTINDYQSTRFGGWPWKRDDPNHGPNRGRFARQPDGRFEEFPLQEA